MELKYEAPQASPHFLRDGGEMGELIRRYDWSASPLGTPDLWPQSLCITIGIMLSSRFPMFLWWGEDLIQFYNDGYRPSLGNEGKHPSALGQKGRDCWAEAWDIIYPLIDQVRTTGQATWSENQLVPIYRNGKIEDVYWTFSYSPIKNENGKADGVFVVCTETTEAVKNLQNLTESEERFRIMAESTDILIAVGDETSNATYFNKAWVKLTGRPMEDLLQFGWADLIHPEDKEHYVNIYLDAFQKKVPFTSEFRVFNKKGNYSCLLANGTPRFRADASFAGYISCCTDITDQVTALRKVKTSELNLRNTVLEAPIGICILDAATLVSEIVNDSFVEVAGKPYEAIAGHYYWDTFAEARPYYEAALNDVVKEGTTFYANEVELMLIRHNKEEIIFVTFVYSPLKDIDGNVEKVAIWVLENTKQVIARRKIEDAEAKARLAIDSADLGVYEIAYTADKITVDDRFKKIWGIETVSDSREAFASAIHPDDLNLRIMALENSLPSGHLDYQTRVLWKDGSVHWVRITGKVMRDEERKPFKLIGVAQDITTSVIAQKKIEDSEKNIRTMILRAPVAMCIFRGPRYVVEIANNKMLELWGKQPAEVIGKPIFEGLPEVKEQGLEQILEHVFTTAERFEALERPVNLPRDGKIETVYVNFVYEVLEKTDNTIRDILAVAVDVTAQVQARHEIEAIVTERTTELATANNHLQRSNAELAQFAYIASHDLQEPIRKISTFSQMLEQSLGQIEELPKRYFDKINRASVQMLSLIRDLLAYSELGKENDIFKQVDLQQIIENTKNDFDLLIEQKNATIEYAGLPVIEAIPLQMSQLFSNLVSNSLKFSRQDIDPFIKISGTQLPLEKYDQYGITDRSNNYYNIEVRDNGIGLSSDNIDKIFNIFQRLHSKSAYAGTGIGLAMCKKITQNHNGKIFALSDKNGAVFNVLLPDKQFTLVTH